MAVTSRLAQINQVTYAQPDFFQGDGFTREAGLTPSDVTAQLFFNSVAQPWTLIDGAATTDAMVRAGHLYWTEVSAGTYSLRVRFNAVGYWRVVLTYAAGQQIETLNFDALAQPPFVESGLKASFTSE